jgi:hypothetical protein
MKLSIIYFPLFIILFYSCKRIEKYSDNFRIESKDVVYGIINLEIDGETFSRKIFDKDSIRQFVQEINNSEYVGSCKGGNTNGFIAIVAKDTCVIRLEIIEDKIRIARLNKCYKLINQINTSR